MKRFWTILLSLLLTACGQDYVRRAYETGVQTNDAIFAASWVAHCDAPSMGAIRRHFGRNTEGLRAYLENCGWSDSAIEAFVAASETPSE